MPPTRHCLCRAGRGRLPWEGRARSGASVFTGAPWCRSRRGGNVGAVAEPQSRSIVNVGDWQTPHVIDLCTLRRVPTWCKELYRSARELITGQAHIAAARGALVELSMPRGVTRKHRARRAGGRSRRVSPGRHRWRRAPRSRDACPVKTSNRLPSRGERLRRLRQRKTRALARSERPRITATSGALRERYAERAGFLTPAAIFAPPVVQRPRTPPGRAARAASKSVKTRPACAKLLPVRRCGVAAFAAVGSGAHAVQLGCQPRRTCLARATLTRRDQLVARSARRRPRPVVEGAPAAPVEAPRAGRARGRRVRRRRRRALANGRRPALGEDQPSGSSRLKPTGASTRRASAADQRRAPTRAR